MGAHLHLLGLAAVEVAKAYRLREKEAEEAANQARDPEVKQTFIYLLPAGGMKWPSEPISRASATVVAHLAGISHAATLTAQSGKKGPVGTVWPD